MIYRKAIILSVPVKFRVEGIRKVKERIADKEHFCVVYFTSSDVLGICALFSSDGCVTDSYFIRGEKSLYTKGILLTEVLPYHISSSCFHCHETIKRYNNGHIPGVRYFSGRLYMCRNGHQGNVALKAAQNLGKLFYARN